VRVEAAVQESGRGKKTQVNDNFPPAQASSRKTVASDFWMLLTIAVRSCIDSSDRFRSRLPSDPWAGKSTRALATCIQGATAVPKLGVSSTPSIFHDRRLLAGLCILESRDLATASYSP
jgi:hypothetical protein